MIDRYSRWPEAIPLYDTVAESCARAFFNGWVSRFGAPILVTTDQGAQFEADLITELSILLGADHIHMTGYYPKANGMMERMHRQLK